MQTQYSTRLGGFNLFVVLSRSTFVTGIILVLSLCWSQVAFSQAASTLVKEAQELGTNNPLTELELGQTYEYQLQWNCSIVSTPPNDCGAFSLTDPLPQGFIFDTCLVSDNLYTCTHNPVNNTVTIDLPAPNVLSDGDSANATIIGTLSTDPDDFPGGLPAALVNTATSNVLNVGSVVATSSPTLNAPANNWEIAKTVVVPGPPLNPALDNDVVYRISICPNGPAGVGTGTIVLENPIVTDACETGATIVGASIRNGSMMNTVLPTTGMCPTVGFDLAGIGVTEFDPADGCQVISYTVQYPSPTFAITDDVTNTANLDGDNIDPTTCPNSCTSSVVSTLDVPMPNAEILKTVKRDSVGVGAFNEYYIDFRTTNTNIVQNNVVVEDVFPTEIQPLSITHTGWGDDDVVANIIELPSNTLLASYDGRIGMTPGFSFPLSPTATGFRVEYTTPVPPGFNGGLYTITYLANDPGLTVGPPPSSFVNCAVVTTDEITADAMVPNPESCQTVTIIENSTDTFLVKSMPPAVQPGQPFTTALSYVQDNTSTVGAVNPTVTDCLSPELDFVSWDSLSFWGLDDPRNPVDTANFDPIGVEPNLEVLEPGAVGNTCTQANSTMLRWSWQATAPSGSFQIGGQAGDPLVNNPFTFPIRPDRNADNIGDATGDLGHYISVNFEISTRVKPGVLQQSGVENFLQATQENISDLRCLNDLSTVLSDVNDIDGDSNTTEQICETGTTFNILSAASLGGEKFVGGFPGLPNFDPQNPPADNIAASSSGIATPVYCADDGFGRTKAPCVAQAMKDQPFEYSIRLSNDGNVPLTNYVVYDVLPNTDVAGSDVGISEILAGVSRGSTWEPQLMGPVVLSSSNATVSAELANAVIEYSALSDSCRPELSVANDTSGGGWQPGCVDDWTETPLADSVTFPEGYASVRSWRIYVPFSGSPWPVGDPFNQPEEDIVVTVPMLAQSDAPASDYEAVPPVLEIAWNNIAHRATNANDGARLLAAEIIKTGIIAPPEYPLSSSGLRIGNLVWLDSDNDGIAELGEQGLIDVTVQLWVDTTGDGPSADDVLFDQMQTNAQGHYLFDDSDVSNRDNLGLPPGDYYVVIPEAQAGAFVLDDNYSSVIDEANADGNVDNDDNGAFDTSGVAIATSDLASPDIAGIYSSSINLALGSEPINEQLRSDDATDDDADFFDDDDSNVSVDFGFYQLRLGNHIWLDLNNNGIAESAEPALANMQVELFLDDGNGVFDPDVDTSLGIDTTDAEGQYLFKGLDEGNYFVAIASGQSGLLAGGNTYTTDTIQSSTPTSVGAVGADNDDDGAEGVFGSVMPTEYAAVSSMLTVAISGALAGENDSSGEGVTGSSATDPSNANVELTQNIEANLAFPDSNSYFSVDFAFVPNVTLGSTVWVDTNGNGTQDVGEGAIAGATVTLLDASGNPIDGDPDIAGIQPVTSLTDANGQYNFNELVPGTYRVSVDLSTSATANIDDYLPSPTQIVDPDDNNPLDSNIDFSLDSNSADLIHISGAIDLLAGTEPTGETDPINATGTGVATDPDQPNQSSQTDNAGNMTLDMGFVPPVSLGSTLWVDDNENGVQDSGETPIINATVTLLNAVGTPFDSDPYVTGVQVLTTLTDAEGQYNFDGLPAGDYRVQVDLSSASNANASLLVPTPAQVADPDGAGAGLNNNTDSNIDVSIDSNLTDQIHVSGAITLVPDTEPTGESDPIGTPGNDQPNQGLTAADDPDASGNMTVDFGFIEPVSLGSTVWFDSNGDGLQSVGEPAIVGVTVTLMNADGSLYDSNPATAPVESVSVITDSSGQYNFNGLPEGDYRVQVDLSSASSHTGAMLSPTPAQVADPDSAGPGQDNNTDSNIDLMSPGHSPATNVYQSGIVTLSIAGEPLAESDPIGVAGSDQPNQTATEPDANGNMTVDFGFFAPVSLGSTIWDDTNANGIQDSGEPAIQGATVTLLNADGSIHDGDPNTMTVDPVMVLTDADGQYNFDGLIPGDYRVQVDLGSVTGGEDFIATPVQVADPDAAGAGQDNNTDSNIDVAFDSDPSDLVHTSGIVTLSAGGEPTGETDPIGTSGADQPNQGLTPSDDPDSSGNMTVDMGFIRPVSLGSTVWLDLNGDGLQTAGELPVIGATLTLLNADGSVFDGDPNTPAIDAVTDVTDAQGQYNFNDLPEGDYRVQVNLVGASNANAFTFVPTPSQVADPDAAGPGMDNNLDSNIDVLIDTNTADQTHTSGIVTLTIGGEPAGEVDPIGTPGADQPNQGLAAGSQPDTNGNMTVDFGFIEPVSLGSTVWFDSDTNGVQDDNEPPIAGAIVTLLTATGAVYDSDPIAPGIQALTSTTGTTGEYNFNGLPAGSYIVQVDLSAVTGANSISPTPLQVADPEDNVNADSNIATVDQNGTPTITADDLYQSGVINLQVGLEPSSELDPIDGVDDNGPVTDQPNQAGQVDNSGNMTVDFGFFQPVSLGSTIWEDLNGDGLQDAGELPIAGATVTLLDAAGNSVPGVSSVITNADGEYNFDGLVPGDYRVQVDLATVVGGSDLMPSPVQVADPDLPGDPSENDNTDSNIDFVFDTTGVNSTSDQIHTSGVITLAPMTEPVGETDSIGTVGPDQPNQDIVGVDPDAAGNMTLDMGFVRPVSLGSTVWQDENADGVQEDGELAIVNATITLLDTFGMPVDGDPYTLGVQSVTTVTDSQGQWFFNDLAPGDYRVQVDLASVLGGAALIPTPTQVADPDAAGDVNTDSNIDIAFDTNTSDQIHTSGIVTLVAGGEPTLEEDPVDSIDDNGVVADQPGQTAANPDDSGNMTVDFGFYAPVSVGSFVWNDSNGDGLQDANEPPIAGAVVSILAETAPGSGVFGPAFAVGSMVAVPPVTVGADGLYEFSNLMPGTYQIQVVPPSGFYPTTTQNAIANDDTENDSNIASEPVAGSYLSAPFLITSGDEPIEVGPDANRGDSQDGLAGGAQDISGNMTIDFGFVPPASLGNYVWLDLDMDGLQDASEDGIANVTVNLFEDSDGNGVIDAAELSTPVATTITGPNGGYLFPGLQPGISYQTAVDISTVPTGLVQTYDEGDGLGASDSLSAPIVLLPNQFHETADFGYAPPAGAGAVGDTIWADADDDGIHDQGEPGIAGVRVNLLPPPDVDLGAGLGVAISTITDANGGYLFPNLPLSETYIVEVDTSTLPAGYAPGPSNLGDPDFRDGNSLAADNQTTVVINSANPIILDLDFGYLPAADQNNVIGDTLWIDVDQDGNGPATAGDGSDISEKVLPGVTITLIQDNGDGVYNSVDDVVFATTTTNDNGMYQFTGLPDGDYIVLVTDHNNILSGLTQTSDADDPANPGAYSPLTPNASFVDDLGVGLAAPDQDLDQDFGYVDSTTSAGDGVIGDTVFFDADASGTPSAGEGVEGVTVQLYAPGPDGVIGGADDVLVGSTVTDANGDYLFTGLDTSDTGPNPGTDYRVVIDVTTLPNGGVGWSNVIDPNTLGAGDSESVTTLSSTSPTNLDQDFGYVGDANNSISGTVWSDSDGDGEQSESGTFAGVTIELLDADGNVLATTETDINGEYQFTGLPDGVYTVVVTDENNVLSGFEHTDSPNGTSDSADQTSKDDTGYVVDLDSAGVNPDPVSDATGDFGYEPVITNPISLGSFTTAKDDNGTVTFSWITQTEVANIGFNLYANIEGEWVLINQQLLPGQGDSVVLQSYQHSVVVDADTFALGDVDFSGKETLHGPFLLGQSYGSIADRKPIDWQSEKDVREAKKAKREARRLDQQRLRSLQRKQRRQQLKGETSMLNKLLNKSVATIAAILIPAAHASTSESLVNLQTTEAGIYEISVAELANFGVDVIGEDASQLSLFNRGASVAIEVTGGALLTADSKLRFIADELDTLYTGTNVYTLGLDASSAKRMSEDGTQISPKAAVATSYSRTAKYAPQSKYSFTSPNKNDPFYAKRVTAIGTDSTEKFTLNLKNVAVGGNTGSTRPKLRAKVWGGTDQAGPQLDHKVSLAFNGKPVATKQFDGLKEATIESELQTVKEGTNQIQLTLSLDNGLPYNVVNLDQITLDYPSKFVAEDNTISFSSNFRRFRVNGFVPSQLTDGENDLIAIRRDKFGTTIIRDGGKRVRCNVSRCQVEIAGTGNVARYFLTTNASVLKPTLSALPLDQDIQTGDANYLIISHPDFIGSNGNFHLENLATSLQSEMGSVDIVDVQSIYAQFGHHIFDPQAIRNYIRFSNANRGTKMVLLVGGDVYDYRQFENKDATSFIPSIYAATGSNVTYAPVDAKYADLDDDNVPDLAIGRLPVRTVSQLGSLMAKRTAYMNRTYTGKVLMVADKYDEVQQYDFSIDADRVTKQYLQGFNVTKAYADSLGTSAARAKVKQQIEAGTTLTAFFGHSSTNQWSFSGLFTGPDAANLNNKGRPTVVTQWGCWNAYYVSPNEDSMGHRFMMEGEQGAVAVMGATTLTDANNERMLASMVFAHLAKGERLGEAVVKAKKEYAQENPNDLDVLLGWTVLGPPELFVN